MIYRAIIHYIDHDNKKIGMVGGAYKNGICTISYYIANTSYTKKGLATEVVCALIDFLHTTYGVAAFEACTHTENIASAKLLAKIDFRIVETSTTNSTMNLYRFTKGVPC